MECLRFAFSDGSSQNSSTCPSCKKPTAVKVVEAACGTMAVKAVENEMRSTVEFDVKNQLLVKKQRCKDLKDINEEARRIFNRISEEVLLKCPRCKQAFHDYDGCNALACKCGAGFCAICLVDCEGDAHKHVAQNHGGLFNKEMFHKSNKERTQGTVDMHPRRIAGEPEELLQLVTNHIQKAGLVQSQVGRDTANMRVRQFLRDAKSNLATAVRNDRLSILSEPDRLRHPLTPALVSPRYTIPSDYRLTLTTTGTGKCSITLFKEELGRWVQLSLEGKDDKPVVDSLTNLRSSLRYAVVAIAGKRCLYQTRPQPEPKGGTLMGDDDISIAFYSVSSNGDVGDACHLNGEYIILGLNPNQRINLLERHVDTSKEVTLVNAPIQHLIGAGNPHPLLDEITSPAPTTLLELNEQQKCVAHPLKVKTAMEVAGPPGTGKTKTITELTRSLLACTDYNIIVLSERNGAIDAIAEKFSQMSMTKEAGKVLGIKDVQMWTNVITFGSSGIGDHTKLFTLEEKLT